MNGHNHDITGSITVATARPAPVHGGASSRATQPLVGLPAKVRLTNRIERGPGDSHCCKQLGQPPSAATCLPGLASRIEVARPRSTSCPKSEEHLNEVVGGPGACVLLATDDGLLRLAAQDYLHVHGYAVATATGGVECVAHLAEFVPDVIVLDADLLWGGADGVLECLHGANGSRVPVVMLAGRCDPASASWSVDKFPVAAVLEKPVSVGTLLWAVRSAIGRAPIARVAGLTSAEETPPPQA